MPLPIWPPGTLPDNPFAWLYYQLVALSGWAQGLGDNCAGTWPLNTLCNPFWTLAGYLDLIASKLSLLSLWYESVSELFGTALSWDSIKAFILEWIPGLSDLVTWIGTWADSVRALIDTWWDGTASDVLDWIYALQDWTTDRLAGVLSFDWFSSWWGNTSTSFAAWWDAQVIILQDTIEVVVKPVRDTVNQHTGAIDLLTSPGDTALRWLLDRIEMALARLW